MSECEECGAIIEDEIFLIISKPNRDFKTKVLGRFCSKCGLKLIELYKKEGNWILEQ